MKNTIQLKLSFTVLAFTLPLITIADNPPQMGNMTAGSMMATNAMRMNDMGSNSLNPSGSAMTGMASHSMNSMAPDSMTGMTTHSMNSMGANSMHAMTMTTNSMNFTSPAPVNNTNSGSMMMATNRPQMNNMHNMSSGGISMTNAPQMKSRNDNGK